MAQTPNFTHGEKISRDWAEVQAKPCCWEKTGTNVSSSYKDILNWSMSLKDTSQKGYFESDLTLPHPCHILKKVA